jgi:hypothetical protein
MITASKGSTIDLSSRVSEALSRIVTLRQDGQRYQITLPVLYPNGNSAAVEISPNGGRLFVSDMGLGHLEAEYSGASAYFDRQAQRVAERYGIKYDGHNVFAIDVSMHQVEAAISAVSNASVQAASSAILKSLEDKDRSWNEEVYERVVSVFDQSNVQRTEDISGVKDIWTAHNVVSLRSGGKAIFEFVSPHANSVANKFMMFSDLAEAKEPLALNCVVPDLEKFNRARGAMLSDLATVITLGASNDQFAALAKAS